MESKFKRLKKDYYEWRHWGYLKQKMVEQQKRPDTPEDKRIPFKNKPGIAFSFDDSFRVLDWYQYGKEIFGYYDVTVTFNINGVHAFRGRREHIQEEVDMLLELQAQGHEIAHHGLNHKNAVKYSNEAGLQRWIKDDIEPLLEWMDNQYHSETGERFKKPVSYAFPYFRHDEVTVKELVPKYFKVVRGHLNGNNLTPFTYTGFAPSICIDSHLLSNPGNIKRVLKAVKETGNNLILTAHSILPEEVKWEEYGFKMSKEDGKWRTSPEVLHYIIHEARKNELEFYTTAEIGGIATFIDSNLEKCVREKLSNPFNPWVFIEELSSIEELDLSNQGISNLDGIQYFSKLKRLNVRNNKITDFRLLEKLPDGVAVVDNENHLAGSIY